MAINIYHTYTTDVEILYYVSDENEDKMPYHLDERMVGTMDDIAEHVCVNLVQHKFVSADVCSAETGEVLMIIERT
ncbi:MAG: hypothetical protein II453_15720 [Alphaproteobacteria bacterium]|nr:hypothetical protein [Alphaproteobacteria bacterium]